MGSAWFLHWLIKTFFGNRASKVFPVSGEYSRYSYAWQLSLFGFKRTPLTSQEQSADANLAKNVNDTDSKLQKEFIELRLLEVPLWKAFQYLLPPLLP